MAPSVTEVKEDQPSAAVTGEQKISLETSATKGEGKVHSNKINVSHKQKRGWYYFGSTDTNPKNSNVTNATRTQLPSSSTIMVTNRSNSTSLVISGPNRGSATIQTEDRKCER